MSRTVIFAAAAAVLACVWLGLSHFGTDGPGTCSFAQALEQIEKAKTITWKMTFYEQYHQQGRKKNWLKTETRATCI